MGPDLPHAAEPFSEDACRYRWPVAVRSFELVDGALVFGGSFDERDLATAQRTYPERRVLLGPDGGIEVYPAGSDWTIWDRWGGVDAARAAAQADGMVGADS